MICDNWTLYFKNNKISKKIITLTISKDKKKTSKKTYKFKMINLVDGNQEYEIELTNPIIIGRLKSGLYTFMDGHIYFNNNVIKIRYDLINSVNN